MDVLSLIGLILAFVAIVGGNFLEGGHISGLLNGPAALIVLGGTLGAVLLQTPMAVFMRAMSIIGWIFFRAVTLGDAVEYLRTMFGGGALVFDQAVYYLKQYAPEFILCLIGIFPLKRTLQLLVLFRRVGDELRIVPVTRGHAGPPQQDLPRGGRQNPVEHVHQGRFPGSVQSNQPYNFICP